MTRYKKIKGIYQKVPKTECTCLHCGNKTMGRPDKKYCDEYCRKAAWDKKNRGKKNASTSKI